MSYRVCEQSPQHPAMYVKRNQRLKMWTYKQYYEDIKRAAKGFIGLGKKYVAQTNYESELNLILGLEPFHSVAILGFNCPEWFISDIGAIFAGGLACGLYPTNSAETNK